MSGKSAKEFGKELQDALLTGVSYMLPFVIGGGVLIALGFLLGGYLIPNDAYGSSFASTVFWLGKVAFGFMGPIYGTLFSTLGEVLEPADEIGAPLFAKALDDEPKH